MELFGVYEVRYIFIYIYMLIVTLNTYTYWQYFITEYIFLYTLYYVSDKSNECFILFILNKKKKKNLKIKTY